MSATAITRRPRSCFSAGFHRKCLNFRPGVSIAYILDDPRNESPPPKEPPALKQYRERVLSILERDGEEAFKQKISRHGYHPELLGLQRSLGIFSEKTKSSKELVFDDWDHLDSFISQARKLKPGLSFHISSYIPGKITITLKEG